MNGKIKHNYQAETYVLSELKKAAESLESIYKDTSQTIGDSKTIWNDSSSVKLMAKAATFSQRLHEDCSELEHIISELRYISNIMHESELKAEELTEN